MLDNSQVETGQEVIESSPGGAMPKLVVGAKVRILRDKAGAAPVMAGDTGVISNTFPDNEWSVRMDKDGDWWFFDGKDLELIEDAT